MGLPGQSHKIVAGPFFILLPHPGQWCGSDHFLTRAPPHSGHLPISFRISGSTSPKEAPTNTSTSSRQSSQVIVWTFTLKPMSSPPETSASYPHSHWNLNFVPTAYCPIRNRISDRIGRPGKISVFEIQMIFPSARVQAEDIVEDDVTSQRTLVQKGCELNADPWRDETASPALWIAGR
jgi:hypothetical protein